MTFGNLIFEIRLSFFLYIFAYETIVIRHFKKDLHCQIEVVDNILKGGQFVSQEFGHHFRDKL